MILSHIYLRVIAVNNYRLKIFFCIFAVVGFIVIFFYDPATMVTAVSSALTLCASAVIPPAYPFMVLSDFIVRSGLCGIVGNYLSPVTKLLFNLSGSTGCVVLMSAVGGYPVGAKMTAQLLENGSITGKQGRRLMLFCVNAGPAFVIGTVGTVMLSSRKAGIILYLSAVMASLFMGVFLRCFDCEKALIRKETTEFNAGVISQSVMHGTDSMLMMCGWILIFSCLNAYLRRLPFDDTTLAGINMITEVTSGCASATELFPVSIQALVIGWGGLSVHCQLFPYVKVTGLRLSRFLLSRIIHGSLATAFATVLFRIFPCEISVFSSQSQILPAAFSVSAPAAAAMLVMCAFVILDGKSKRLLETTGRI